MYENFIGVALVIVVTLIVFAILAKPVVRGILKEVRDYHRAETKDALDSIAKLLGSFATTALAIMAKNDVKKDNPFSMLTGGETPKTEDD